VCGKAGLPVIYGVSEFFAPKRAKNGASLVGKSPNKLKAHRRTLHPVPSEFFAPKRAKNGASLDRKLHP